MVLFALAACLRFVTNTTRAQEPTWEELKKAAEEAGQEGEFTKQNQLLKAAFEEAEKSFDAYGPRLAEALKQLVVMGSPIATPTR